MDFTRIVVVACAIFVALGAFVYANHRHQQAVAYKARLADEQTVQVTAASAHGRVLAQRLLVPRLALILDPQSPTFETDAAFAEQIFSDAVAVLYRYRDISRDTYIDQVIAGLEQGTTRRAIDHFKRTLALKMVRNDSRAMARSYLHTGALYLISNFGRAGSDLRVAADLDDHVVRCMDCLERLIARLGGGTRVAEVPATVVPPKVAPTPKGVSPPKAPLPTQPAPQPLPSKKVAEAAKPQSPANVDPVSPADAPGPTDVAPPQPAELPPVQTEQPPRPDAEQPGEADASEPAEPHSAARPRPDEVVPLVRFEPEYPPQALRRGIEGYVVLEFVITRSGKVVDIRVIEAVPPGVFERAAERALRKWRYGKGVGPLAGMRVRFEFKVR